VKANRRGIGRPARRWPFLAVIAIASASGLAGCGDPATSQTVQPAPPIATALESSGQTAVVVPMGDLADPLNTFWQLAVLEQGRWSVVTPPNVATNGGIVAAFDGRNLAAAVLPSQLLGLTPLAWTRDEGRTWTPEVLDEPVAVGPTAMAASIGSTSYAVTGGTEGGLVASSPGLATWRQLASNEELARALGAGCRLRGLTAVGITRDGQPIVGGVCDPGATELPLLLLEHGSWRRIGPPTTAPGGATVLALDVVDGDLEALVDVGAGHATTIEALTLRRGSARWQRRVLVATLRGTVASVALGPRSAVVVVRDGAGVEHAIEEVAGQVLALPQLPQGTEVVVPGAGPPTAIVVHRSTFEAFDRSGRTWRSVQRLAVTIPDGSSN
jgi:hypothetical protein